MRKATMKFLYRSDTNRAVSLYYLCNKNKDDNQLCSYFLFSPMHVARVFMWRLKISLKDEALHYENMSM